PPPPGSPECQGGGPLADARGWSAAPPVKDRDMMRRSLLTAAALALLLSPAARAAKVKVWHQSRPAHFDKAKLRHAVVSSEGTLRLSRRLRPFAGLEATHVWDLVEDGKGNLYAATGEGGKVYKVTPDGKAVVLHAIGRAHV